MVESIPSQFWPECPYNKDFIALSYYRRHPGPGRGYQRRRDCPPTPRSRSQAQRGRAARNRTAVFVNHHHWHLRFVLSVTVITVELCFDKSRNETSPGVNVYDKLKEKQLKYLQISANSCQIRCIWQDWGRNPSCLTFFFSWNETDTHFKSFTI